MADAKQPTLAASAPCAVGRPLAHPIRSAVLLAEAQAVLTLEGDNWITRQVADGAPAADVAHSPCIATETMWTDRIPSPDGRWLIALNGQTSIECRPAGQMERSWMIDWPSGIPKGFGYWVARPNYMLTILDGGITEVWDLDARRRIAWSPAVVEALNSGPQWAPIQPGGDARLQLSQGRAVLTRGEQSPPFDLRPVGRWPLAGGGISPDGQHALLATGGPSASPQVDWWASGEILQYDLSTGQLAAAAAHGVLSGPGLRACAIPSLSHTIFHTAEGALVCVESASGRTVWALGLPCRATAAVFSDDGRRCMVGFHSGEVALLGERPGEVLWRVKAHEFAITRAAISNDLRRAVTEGADHSLVCWNASVGNPIAGAPPRYDRIAHALALAQQPQSAGQIAAQMGPSARLLMASADLFVADFGGQAYRCGYEDLANPRVLLQGHFDAAPDGRGMITYEYMQVDKKKKPQLAAYFTDIVTGERHLMTTFEPPEPLPRPPVFLSALRIILPLEDGRLGLMRLNKKIGALVKLPLEPAALAGPWTFIPAHDASAFAIGIASEFHVFNADDGKLMGQIRPDPSMPPAQAVPVACWVGPQGREVKLLLRGGTLQHWML